MMATGAVLGAGLVLPGTVFAGAGGSLLPSNSGMLGGDAVNVAKPEVVEGKDEKDGPEEGEPEPTVQVGGSRQFSSAILANQDPSYEPWRSDPVVIPSYSAWFRMDSVHSIERRALPMILDGSDAAEASYLELRNAMVHLYREAPHKLLSASDCLHFIPRRADKTTSTPVCAVSGQPLGMHTRVRYEAGGIVLSNAAFASGLLPATAAPWDFQKSAAADPVIPSLPNFDDWAEDETLKLLDALQRCGDEWDVVSQLVGTKNMEQCVRHFAALPIADQYLADAHARRTDQEARALRGHARGAVPPRALSLDAAPRLSSQLRALLAAVAVDPEGQALRAAMRVLDARAFDGVEVGPSGGAAEEECAVGPPPGAAKWLAALRWPPNRTAANNSASEDGVEGLMAGDLAVLLAQEVGGCARVRVEAVHGRRGGAVFVDVLVAGKAPTETLTMQLDAGELRVLCEEEVKAVEEALGRGFLDIAPEKEAELTSFETAHPQAGDKRVASALQAGAPIPLLQGTQRAVAVRQAAAKQACASARVEQRAERRAKRLRHESVGTSMSGVQSEGVLDNGEAALEAWRDSRLAEVRRTLSEGGDATRTRDAMLQVLRAGVARTAARLAALTKTDALLEEARDAL